jgi:hypothetical protein
LLTTTLKFNNLENKEFVIRKFKSLADLFLERNVWLRMIGFPQAQLAPRNQSITRQLESQVLLDLLYEFETTALERKSIEAGARAINVKIRRFDKMLFVQFERHYEIYFFDCFNVPAEYNAKRKEWLRMVGLDRFPFNYFNERFSETFHLDFYEVCESAWFELSDDEAKTVFEKAERVKQHASPFFASWTYVFQIYGTGYNVGTTGLDPNLHSVGEKESQEEYNRRRAIWIATIWETDYRHPYIGEELELKWQSMEKGEKFRILKRVVDLRKGMVTREWYMKKDGII